jgi:hypothetical protein
MPASLWELIFRAVMPHRHAADTRLRDARIAARKAEAKLKALDLFTQRMDGALRKDPP